MAEKQYGTIGEKYNKKALESIGFNADTTRIFMNRIKNLPEIYGPMLDAVLTGDKSAYCREIGKNVEEYPTMVSPEKLEFFLDQFQSEGVKPVDPEASLYRFNLEYHPEKVADVILRNMQGFVAPLQEENQKIGEEIGKREKAMNENIKSRKAALKDEAKAKHGLNFFKRWSYRRTQGKVIENEEKSAYAKFKAEQNAICDKNSALIAPYSGAMIASRRGNFDWVKSMDEMLRGMEEAKGVKSSYSGKYSDIARESNAEHAKPRSMSDKLQQHFMDNKQIQGSQAHQKSDMAIPNPMRQIEQDALEK